MHSILINVLPNVYQEKIVSVEIILSILKLKS